MAGYYCRFVNDFSRIVLPIAWLTHKGVLFVWDETCEKAFFILKDKLSFAYILILPELGKGYMIYYDASRLGLRNVLMQDEHMVAYACH